MSAADALAFFRAYDALAVKEGFDASIGPAMIKDSDDPRNADLLAQIIANSKILEGSVIIAGEDGIHWKSIHATAGVIEYLAAHTAHSQGNFNFTAAALVPPNTPFYPGILHRRRKAFRDRVAIRKRRRGRLQLGPLARRSRIAPPRHARPLRAGNRGHRKTDRCANRLEIWRHRSLARTAQRRLHRRRHRKILRRAARLKRHSHRRSHHHPRPASKSLSLTPVIPD